MSDSLSDAILVSLYDRPGRRAREIASDLQRLRQEVNSELYGALSEHVVKDHNHQWWPITFHKAGTRGKQTLARKAALLVALKSRIRRIPRCVEPDGPLDLTLTPPLPPRARFYLFELKLPNKDGRRARINLTVNKTNKSNLRTFDHTDPFRPILLGYSQDEDLFVMWEASIYEMGKGFKYNRACYVTMETLFRAAAIGIARERRHLRKPRVQETVIACRPERLATGLKERHDLDLQRILED